MCYIKVSFKFYQHICLQKVLKRIRRPMFYNGFLCWALTSCKFCMGQLCSVNVSSINVLYHSIEYTGVNEHFALKSWAVIMFHKESDLDTVIAMTTTLTEPKNMH